MKKQIIFAAITFFVMASFAQPGSGPGPQIYKSNQIKMTSGTLAFLKNAKQLLLEFNYDDMLVGSLKESDYMVKHADEMNRAKPGTGDEWKTKWVSDRASRFEPEFEKRFVKGLSKLGINASKTLADAQYKLILKTVVTEPGLYTGVSYVTKATYVDIEATFVEIANPDVVLCKISCLKMIGEASSFANYDIGNRITAAYTNCAIRLSGFIVKAVKKIK